MAFHNQRKKFIHIAVPVLLILIGVLAAASVLYLKTGNYSALSDAVACVEQPQNEISVTGTKGSNLIFAPDGEIQAGLIFYPGGKVDYRAYAPLMSLLAENGVLCVLVHMPCSLAILNIGAANGIQEQFPEVSRWYIGGHSLGGACASMYLQKHSDAYKGLILLGAYSSVDLSQSGLSVLSIYGENDGVLNREKYEKDLANLPNDFTEVVIPGGCHAYYGDYGMQKGDGTPALTPEEQQQATADAILNWMNR